MKTIRRLLTLLFASAAVLAALYGIVEVRNDGWTVDNTIANNIKVAAAFTQSVDYIEKFRRANNRLPTSIEFKKWNSSFPQFLYTPNGMYLETSSFSVDAVSRLGAPRQGGYVLSYWMGEWFEYYASWSGQSTLNCDPKAYSLLGSNRNDGIAALLVAIFLTASASRMWPNPSFKRTPSGAA